MHHYTCANCYSSNLSKCGKMVRSGIKCQRYKCIDCFKDKNQTKYTYVPLDSPLPDGYREINDIVRKHEKYDTARAHARQRAAARSKDEFSSNESQQEYIIPDLDFDDIISKVDYIRDDYWVESKLKAKKFVITSAQSDTNVDKEFFDSLKNYCRVNKAELLIIPVKYKNPTLQEESNTTCYYDPIIQPYLFENNIKLHEKLKVMGSIKISATAENPLSGLAPLSKGDSVIIGHNQLQMLTLPVQPDDFPVIMSTTGSVSEKNYSISKQGHKGEFNHSKSAVIVELDDDIFHIRHLNFDGIGFYDIYRYYEKDIVREASGHVKALVTGDEHVTFFSEEVYDATYSEIGIVAELKPEFIVRHDVLDCYSITHHHKKNFLTKFKKYINETNNVTDELKETIDFVIATTPETSTNIIVSSNHNDHLIKWLNECDIKTEPWNAITYHYIMFKMLSEISKDSSYIPNPFELYSSGVFKKNNCKVDFISRRSSYKIFDIEIAIHGDKGINGARGSRESFAKLPSKTIIGHSHSPGIEKGCYQTGTSSILNLEYNDGPSSWLNTHCLIYANGKRQLINIIKGKWKA